jgi:TolA-binding protein
VRSRTAANRSNNPKSRSGQGAEQRKVKKDEKDNSNDTTYIYLTPEINEHGETSDLTSEYWKAVDEFNNEDYANSCNRFKKFVEAHKERDSVFYDSKFYLAECLIMNQDLESAEKMLQYILEQQSVPSEIIEKSIVRLGHIYCAQNKNALATRMFNRLKNEFPDSKYLKVASCD